MNNIKVLILFCALFFLASKNSWAQGPDCPSANLVQVTLPYVGPAETTCLMGNNYNDNNMTETCTSPANPGAFMYTRGADKLYAFTPTISGSVLITLSTNSAGDSSGLFVFDGCPDIGSCVGSNIGSSTIKNFGLLVSPGRTYYVMVDRKLGPTPLDSCILTYSLSITLPDPYCPSFEAFTGNGVPNLDFEAGDMSNWIGHTGTCCEVNTPNNGIVDNRHTITSVNNGNDPFAMGAIPQVAPGGGRFSARLGNSNNGAQAEKLTHSFIVTKKTNVLLYKYAIVLEDAGHNASQQPRFEVNVFDQANQLVDCGQYKVVVNASTPCFKVSPIQSNVYYREWTTVGVDLSNYLGEKITVEYATGDCGAGAHFGYAYLDASATTLDIQTKGNICDPNGTVQLIAPAGFARYKWSGPGVTDKDTFQILTVSPVLGSNYSVDLTSVSDKSCLSTLSKKLEAAEVVANFSTNEVCEGSPTNFIDESTTDNLKANIAELYWDFGDGNTSNELVPSHIYDKAGIYTAKLIVINTLGCMDSVQKTVRVMPPLETPTPYCSKQTETGLEFSWSPINGAIGYLVSSDNGLIWQQASSGFSNQSTSHFIDGLQQGDTVSLVVRAMSLQACNSLPDSVICNLSISDCSFYFSIPNAFSPNGDGINDLFYGHGNCISSYSLRIFNRWGEKVYSTEDPDPSKGWNGDWGNSSGSRKAPLGLYVFVAKVKDFQGNEFKYVGAVSLTE
ncbi:MAG: gliding motility-associated-like protein [Sphingobacteriales bacterium]|jgi:gliding motility-associated-like protein